MFKWLNSYGANNVVQFVVHLKLMCLRDKPTYDDIIKAKEVYIQLSFGRYMGNLSVAYLKSVKYPCTCK